MEYLTVNDKRAKSLRGLAKQIGKQQQLPTKSYLVHKDTGQIINNPQSVRGVYRHFKKLVRKFHGGTTAGRTNPTPSG